MLMKKFSFSCLILLLIAACANPINRHTAATYYEAGMQALKQRNLPHAKEMFTRSLLNARLGQVKPEDEADILL